MNETKQIDAKTFWRALGARATGVVVATARGKHRQETGRRLTPPAVRALLLLVTTAIAGALITALR